MWIETLKNGKLRAVERYKDPLTGKDRKVSVMIEKDTAAQRKKALAALQSKIDQKVSSPELSCITFGELCDKQQEEKKKFLKASSIATTKRHYTHLKEILGKDTLVDRINARYFKEQMNKSDKNIHTKNDCISFFKSLMRWAYKNDYIHDISFLEKIDKYKEIEITSQSQRMPYLEREELTNLLEHLNKKKWKDLATFLALTGMRIGEALALTYEDVDLQERTISITKTFSYRAGGDTSPKTESSIREIYIQDELMDLAKNLKVEAMRNNMAYQLPYLFQENGRRCIERAFASYLIRQAPEGMKISPHTFRHTHVALLAESGLSLEEISRRLGHEKNSDTTRKVYFHVTKKLKEQDYKRIEKISIVN